MRLILPLAFLTATAGACATFDGQEMEPRTVAIEVSNNFVPGSSLTIWVATQGRYTRLGTVPPRSTGEFGLELTRTGLYRLVAYRSAPSTPDRYSRTPPGELVASSDGFSISPGTERVLWNMEAGYVETR